MNNQPYKFSLSVIYLIIANLIPIFGVAFFDWSLYQILLMYWLENIAIGFYTILKIAKARGGFMFAPGCGQTGNLFKLFIIPFFIIHFGGFTVGHGIFIYAIFGPNGMFPEDAVQIVPLVIIFCFFIISHGVSFWQNYINKEEFLQMAPMELVFSPYKRIFVTHISIIGGVFVFIFLGLNGWSRIIIIVLKTYLDYKFHLREHKKIRLSM